MGCSLHGSAARWAHDEFEAWDPDTGAWSATAVTGRLFRADRFTTIYHRPTRRATIGLLGAAPASLVVRRRLGGDTFLLSATERQEVLQGALVYDTLRASHLVTSPSGGLADFRPARVSGSGDDLGWVTMEVTDQVYLDLELQAAVSPEGTDDVLSSRWLLNHSPNISPVSGDYVEFEGRMFLVQTPYVDGGFRLARAVEISIGYKPFVYMLKTAGGGYNPATGTVVKGEVERNVSVLVGSSKMVSNPTDVAKSKRVMTLYIFTQHVGFTPRAGDTIKDTTRTYKIESVTLHREELQWELEVSY